MKDLWSISTSEHADGKETIMRRGNVYQIANGYMGYRGTLDEYSSEQLVGITLAGIYDRVGSAWREPVNAPNGGFTSVSLGGADLSALGKKVARHRQTLRFDNAMFQRETAFASRGTTVTVKSTRFLSAETPNLGVIRFTLTCDRAATVTIRTGIDGNIWDLNGPHLLQLSSTMRDSVLVVEGLTNESSKRVVVAEAADIGFGVVTYESGGNRNLRVVHLRAEAGKSYTFHKYFAVFTDNDSVRGTVVEAAVEAVQQARLLGYERCLAGHNASWLEKWARCDVTIDGDDEAQLALRYSILQLLMVAPVHGQRQLDTGTRAFGPGLQGGDLLGHGNVHVSVLYPHLPGKGGRADALPDKDPQPGARRKAKTEGWAPGARSTHGKARRRETTRAPTSTSAIRSRAGPCEPTSGTSRCTSAATWPSPCGTTSG